MDSLNLIHQASREQVEALMPIFAEATQVYEGGTVEWLVPEWIELMWQTARE